MSVDGVRIRVRVVPRTLRDEIIWCNEAEAIRIRVTRAPVKGAVNRRVAELLARKLRVGKSKVRVVSGLKSRNKVVEVAGESSLRAVTERLKVAARCMEKEDWEV